MERIEMDMLEELQGAEDGMSGWELDFIENLNAIKHRELSEKQADKLRDIWSKVFGS